MSLLDKIPLPGTPFEGMMQGQELMQKFLMGPVERRHREAQAKHQEAQAKREEALANMPFGGHQLTGVAGQVMGLEMMKALYGENSPQYQMARNAFDLEQRNTEGLINYRGSLQETMPKRTATTLGKEQMEMEDINNGYLPGTNIRLTPDQQANLLERYKLKVLKETTDESSRKRALFAKNMDQTMARINPVDLTRYAGIKGRAQLAKDKAKAALGHTVPEYKNYERSLKAADVLQKQIRQFLGDSITPEIDKKLALLVKTDTWLNNPEIALQNFNEVKAILDTESETLRQSLNTTKAYEKENDKETSELERNIKNTAKETAKETENLDEGESNIEKGLITVIDPNGDEHLIFRDKLPEAQKKYNNKLKVKKEPFSAAKI
jgi:hypothetical protein